jgi:hypothetical protein
VSHSLLLGVAARFRSECDGKLKTERMVPVDSFVCELVQRLRFFRSFDPLPDGRLLARHSGKHTLMKRLRPYLSDVAAEVGISTRIVPHQA